MSKKLELNKAIKIDTIKELKDRKKIITKDI